MTAFARQQVVKLLLPTLQRAPGALLRLHTDGWVLHGRLADYPNLQRLVGKDMGQLKVEMQGRIRLDGMKKPVLV